MKRSLVRETAGDRTETLRLLAPHMAEGQLRQARALLADPWGHPRGSREANLLVAVRHVRAALGWIQAAE